MVKRLKNLNKIKMNNFLNRMIYCLIQAEFYSPLSLKHMLDDNQKNHHDFLELIMKNLEKILKLLIKYNLYLILNCEKKKVKEIKPTECIIRLCT